MARIPVVGTRENPMHVGGHFRLSNVGWAVNKVLVVDIEYNANFSPAQFPAIPVSSKFLVTTSPNWFEIKNLRINDQGNRFEVDPLITSASEGSTVLQNSIWRETILANVNLLKTYFMWQQARLDFLTFGGQVVGTNGRGTLYFNLSKIRQFFTIPNEPFVFDIQFPDGFLPVNDVPTLQPFKLRAATYKKRLVFPVKPRESNRDLEPDWEFYTDSKLVSVVAGTNATRTVRISVDFKTLIVSVTPAVNGEQWTT